MTIQFYCPNCDELIAFDEKHRGKRARCTTCSQLFIIPSEDYQTPRKIEPQIQKPEPIPGFYRTAFLDSFKLFINPENATPLVFVIAAVCFKFFTGHLDYSFTVRGTFRFQAPLGQLVTIAAWGCLFWYYMEIICSTAFEAEQLPEPDIGGFFGFIWNVVKSVFIFSITLMLVELPCIISMVILRKTGVELPVLTHILAIAGLFVFPIAIATVAIGRDITMLFRPDYFLPPLVRAFWPYLLVVALFILTWELQLHTVGYGRLLREDRLVVALHLLANLAVQALAIIAMRSIGLFYRHYSCHFQW
jgi:hypothetical protein